MLWWLVPTATTYYFNRQPQLHNRKTLPIFPPPIGRDVSVGSC